MIEIKSYKNNLVFGGNDCEVVYYSTTQLLHFFFPGTRFQNVRKNPRGPNSPSPPCPCCTYRVLRAIPFAIGVEPKVPCGRARDGGEPRHTPFVLTGPSKTHPVETTTYTASNHTGVALERFIGTSRFLSQRDVLSEHIALHRVRNHAFWPLRSIDTLRSIHKVITVFDAD